MHADLELHCRHMFLLTWRVTYVLHTELMTYVDSVAQDLVVYLMIE